MSVASSVCDPCVNSGLQVSREHWFPDGTKLPQSCLLLPCSFLLAFKNKTFTAILQKLTMLIRKDRKKFCTLGRHVPDGQRACCARGRQQVTGGTLSLLLSSYQAPGHTWNPKGSKMVPSQLWIPRLWRLLLHTRKRGFMMSARKWVYRLREKCVKSSLPVPFPWQLGPGLWSRDKAVIGERGLWGGTGFSPQMMESPPSPVILCAAQVMASHCNRPPLPTVWEIPADSPTVPQCWLLPGSWFVLPASVPF